MSAAEAAAPVAPARFRNAVALLVDAREPGGDRAAELERAGQPALVFTLHPSRPAKRKPAILDRSIDVPAVSLAVLVANARRLSKSPARYVAAAMKNMLTPRRLLAAGYIADTVEQRGIRHLHAFGATAGVGQLASQLAKVSVTVGGGSTDELLDRFAVGERTTTPAAVAILSLDWNGVGLRPVGTRWMASRPDSTVAEVEVFDGTARRGVIYKDVGPEQDGSRTAAERARHEYDTYNMLHDAMSRGPAAFSVPRALLLDEPRGIVLLERAPGTPLDELIASTDARSSKGELAREVRRAGEWLHAMQQNTRIAGDGGAALASLVRGAAADVERVARTDATLRRSRKAILARLRELASRVEMSTLPLVGHHGDYWPGNVFISPERVVVIDFEGFRHGLPLEDAAYFLIMLELLCRRFPADVPALRDAFLEGYAPGVAPERHALELFTVAKALQLAAHSTTKQPFVLRRFTEKTLRRIIVGSAR